MIANKIFPGIHLYENAITESDNILSMVKSDINNWKINEEHLDDIYPLIVSFKSDPLIFNVIHNIHTLADKYSRENGCTFSNISSIEVVKYKKTNGFPKINFDQNIQKERIFSATVFLNNISSGGEMVFNQLGCSIKTIKNNVIFYPASYTYSYKLTVPSEDRYCLNLGFMD